MAAAGRGERLYFIDVARAVAILMMLQGHFIAVSLSDSVRSLDNPYYAAHSQLRTLTAPLFLTVSGMVFVFFLCAGGGKLRDNPRVLRGLRRGGMLIGLGYLMHVNVLLLAADRAVGLAFLITCHVLHVVGVGLLCLLAAFALQRVVRIVPLAALLAALGLATFLATPPLRAAVPPDAPTLLANYLVSDHGSVFTLLPWLGYSFFGGCLGALSHRASRWSRTARGWLLPLSCMAAGLSLYLRATRWVFSAYRACPAALDCSFLTPSHVWLGRLGLVVAFIGALMWMEPILRKRVPEVLLQTGQQTLFVYLTHAVLLYGAVTGVGLDRVLRRALSPAQAIAGALLFMALHVALVQLRSASWTRPRNRTRSAQPSALA